MIVLAAALVFLATAGAAVAGWFWLEAHRALSARLGIVVEASSVADATLLRARAPQSVLTRGLGRFSLGRRLFVLAAQAGSMDTANDWGLIVLGCALVGLVAAVARTASIPLGAAGAVAGGAVPVLLLLHRRQRRLRRFEEQFSGALDMMTRSLRAGHALGGAIKHVGDHMPDPVGVEFRRLAEEIRLGLDPGDALSGLQQRVPTEDVRFFCTAVRIQRGVGGNLAEILDRLSEVIRERFKLLSQARALSAQHRWSAICVGVSPMVFALVFGLLQPGYFDALWNSPSCSALLGAGFALEAVGFFSVWRIAHFEV
jgi:tight adherence protein B